VFQSRIAVGLTLGLALGTSPAAFGQEPPATRPFDRPESTFPEPFSRIAGLRQLADGRLIVTDRLEKAVRILDFAAGTYDEIGHVGSGPGEFQVPGDLLPLPADSTLLVDFGNMRLSVIGTEGRFHRSTSMQQTVRDPDGGSGVVMVMPEAADAEGGLYFDMTGSFAVGPDGPPDSAAIVRWEFPSTKFDTVAMLPAPAIGSVTVGSRGGASFRAAGGGPLSPRAAWAATPDGRTALVWPEPYHVEWVRRDGERLVGPTIPYRPIPVTAADKEAWAEGMAGGAVMVVSGSEGGRSFTLPKPDPDDMDWPSSKPAFQSRGVHAAPDGRLWVQRYVEAGAPDEFDVFDGGGVRVARVILPPDHTLIGFGPGFAYLARTDEDDLQWIERHRLFPIEQ
jgi:hypothetical protein